MTPAIEAEQTSASLSRASIEEALHRMLDARSELRLARVWAKGTPREAELYDALQALDQAVRRLQGLLAKPDEEAR